MSLSQKDGGLPPDSVVQTADQILEDSERVIKLYHDASPMAMHKIVLAPCSPFSVTKELMRDSARLARKYGVRLHTHLAETRDENDFCIQMYGKRPVALMQECELIGPEFLCPWYPLHDEELRILAEAGAHIAIVLHPTCALAQVSAGCRRCWKWESMWDSSRWFGFQ